MFCLCTSKKKKIRTRLLQENNSELLEIFNKFFRQTSCVGTRKFGKHSIHELILFCPTVQNLNPASVYRGWIREI